MIMLYAEKKKYYGLEVLFHVILMVRAVSLHTEEVKHVLIILQGMLFQVSLLTQDLFINMEAV